MECGLWSQLDLDVNLGSYKGDCRVKSEKPLKLTKHSFLISKIGKVIPNSWGYCEEKVS